MQTQTQSENAKGVTRSHNSKRQTMQWPCKKKTKTNNDLEITTQKTNDLITRIPHKS